MALASTYKIPAIQKLLKELEEEANRYNDKYAQGILYCIEKIREIIDSA